MIRLCLSLFLIGLSNFLFGQSYVITSSSSSASLSLGQAAWSAQTVALSASQSQSNLLMFNGFNFQFIPAYANIIGFEISVDATVTGEAYWQQLQLVKGQTVTGSNLASGKINSGITTFGSLTELWGSTWSRNELNSGMGVAVSVKSNGAATVSIRKLNLKVYYQSTSSAMIMTNFAVEKTASNSVNINFGTSTEENIKELWVERSSDGRHFQPLIQVTPRGRRNAYTTYQETDKQPLIGRNYYRLKEVDTDGQSFYYDIRSVLVSKSGDVFTAFAGSHGIQLVMTGLKGTYTVRLFTGEGIPVNQQQLLLSGPRQESLPLPLKAGIYHVILSGEGVRESRSIYVNR